VLSSRSGDYFVVQSSGTSNRVTWKVLNSNTNNCMWGGH
jgi:hypothetical protein